jgi:phosphoenolpyruvate phosphomutase
MVIARVEALIAGWGQEEALKRAHAYAEAGADAILMHSKSKDPEQILTFLKAWDRDTPVVVVPTTYFNISAQDLGKAGVTMVIYANQGLRTAISAMEQSYKRILSEGSTTSIETSITPMKTVFELQGMPQMKKDEEIYLRTGQERTRAVIPGAGDHLEEHSMKHIASEIPMAMLDISGKPLLQRQSEMLNISGIGDVTVVGGYRSQAIQVEGVKLAVNEEWESTGEMRSILCAGKDYDGRTLVAYSDIMFDTDSLGKILGTGAGIAVMVDRSYDSKVRGPDRRLDLVQLDSVQGSSRRSLDLGRPAKVKRIGKTIDPEAANCEFAGLALFDRKGFELLASIYEEVCRKGGSPFHEAGAPEKASLTDMLQELIDRGEEVAAVEVSSGWMEIHSFDDYKLACEIVPV